MDALLRVSLIIAIETQPLMLQKAPRPEEFETNPQPIAHLWSFRLRVR